MEEKYLHATYVMIIHRSAGFTAEACRESKAQVFLPSPKMGNKACEDWKKGKGLNPEIEPKGLIHAKSPDDDRDSEHSLTETACTFRTSIDSTTRPTVERVYETHAENSMDNLYIMPNMPQ
jgi:hypothetical protein